MLEHQEYGQTNAVFEKVKVVGTFLSFHLLSHTEAGHMSPILAEFRGGRGVVAVVVKGGDGMFKSIRTHWNCNVRCHNHRFDSIHSSIDRGHSSLYT